MPYKNPTPRAEVAAKLAYDPETGVFTWKVDVARNVKAGSEAGCVKASRVGRDGVPVSYRYIKLGHDIPAARVAWLLHYGEWPAAKLLFVDGDTLNLRIDNLKEANSLLKQFDHSDPEQRKAYLKAHREAYPKAWKDSDLQRTFGISLAQYSEMVAAQDNRCAICSQPEIRVRNGKVKALAVDHNHETGAIRGLLCSDCNTGIGKLKDNRDVLLAAVKYLDKHSESAPNVTVIGSERKQ